MHIAQPGAHHVFLTGATGFVGKVVLAELLRRRKELRIDTIYVLIRTKKGKAPQQRFEDEIAGTKCFDLLPDDWTRHVRAIAGELTHRECGMSEHDVQLLTGRVTRIVHVAASVEFNLPIAEAASANITSALNVLDLAKRCKHLQRMVSVSTAYVTPWKPGNDPIFEGLVPLPRAPDATYRSILDGTADEKALMAETGHPNTYTFTKCIAEHLLVQNKGDVPLVIVRPSIVSATWRHPFPGWIDSAAAFAGFVMLIGMGRMKALVADRSSRLDIVPCDIVADRVIDNGFADDVIPTTPDGLRSVPIRYAVAGLAHSCRVDTCAELIARFFRAHPVDKVPGVTWIGPASKRFKLREMRDHTLPARLAGAVFKAIGNGKMHKMAGRMGDKLVYVNQAFPYFTHKTFDFRATQPIDDPLFRREEYLELVCRGVYRHLLRRDETEMSLAGKRHTDEAINDFAWAASKPHGNLAIRTFALAVRKALRQTTQQVTFDRPSFDRAMQQVAPGSLPVLIPSHRSYMDFLLCSYLFFARPDLGISIPHIAAAEEFSKIPILGELFKQTHAFYLKRGEGKADTELTRHVHELVRKRETIQFFIEGARSRSRQFLAPRHGLLRCLQQTGETFTLLPIALTYDRLPEEESLIAELTGGGKPEMKLRALLAWTTKMAQGKVHLGRVHIRCGDPVIMAPLDDVREISRHVMAELQDATASSTHHLRAFLHHGDVAGIELDWLRDAIERRGGQVIDSPLGGESELDPVTEQCMRYHWIHLFYHEAKRVWPDHPAVVHHAQHNGWHWPQYQASEQELADPRLHKLLRSLFVPVARDYAQVAEHLGNPLWPLRHPTPQSMLHDLVDAHLPNLQAAYEDLASRGVLQLVDKRRQLYQWGPHAEALQAYRLACEWPEDRVPAAAPVLASKRPRPRAIGA